MKGFKSGEEGKERDDKVKKKKWFGVIKQQSSLLKVERVEVQYCHREIEANTDTV